MRTGLTISKESNGIMFYGEISATDIMKLKLDTVDTSLMECKSHEPPANQLLVMEMLFRRIQEQL